MSQTETKTVQKNINTTFGFYDLKTVKWVSSVRAVDQVAKYTKDKSTTEKFPLMAWIFATIEMFIIHIYLFIHSLPWPDFIVNIIKRIDIFIENFLEYVHDKLDWAKNRQYFSSKRKEIQKSPEKNIFEQFFNNLTKKERETSKKVNKNESETFLLSLQQYLENFKPSSKIQDPIDSSNGKSDPPITLDIKINGKSIDPLKAIQEKSEEVFNTVKKQNLEDLMTKLKNHYNQNLNTEEEINEENKMNDLWWDVLMVRLIRLRDSIEALIDAFLSVCLFVVYKVIEFWMKVFNLCVEFLKIIFAPAIWIFKTIFPPPEAEKKSTSTQKPVIDQYPSTGQNGANKQMNDGAGKVNELDEQTRFSPTTSDCESDVSAVSETWSIGHTDKYGKYYNRVEMKATAEGRLRAAMYKRVKAQLSLMRKNSVSISKGMTSYAIEHLVPRVKPKANALIQWIKTIAAKYGLDEVYIRILREKDNHYLLSVIFSSVIYITLAPLKLLNKTLLHEKKKSRRTRSMRSESLRRRTGNNAGVVVSQIAGPYGLNLSKEPVVNEESEFNNLKEIDTYLPKKEESEKEERSKLEDDPMRDSALASSIDDLYVMSDSNDGANSLKDQTIHEEESEENLTHMENGKITSSEEDLRSSNRSELSSSKEDIDVNKETKLEEETVPHTKKQQKQRKQPHHQQNSQQQQQQQQQQHQQPKQQQNKTEQSLKAKPVPVNNGDTQPSPQTRKKSIIMNKDAENSCDDQRKENNGKSPKRKISFSLT